MENDSCKDVGVLDAKIKSLENSQEALMKSWTAALIDVKGMIKDLSNDIKEQMTNITTQTNSQEVRLALIEKATTQQSSRVDELEKTSNSHGIRLAQVAIVAVLISLLLPVAFEQWLTDRPLQSEIGYAHD